jgi:hypothetical protein
LTRDRDRTLGVSRVGSADDDFETRHAIGTNQRSVSETENRVARVCDSPFRRIRYETSLLNAFAIECVTRSEFREKSRVVLSHRHCTPAPKIQRAENGFRLPFSPLRIGLDFASLEKISR